MKKKIVFCLSIILFAGGCAFGRQEAAVSPTPTPFSGVKVITLAPEATPTPAPVIIPEGDPARVTDLSGKYDIFFPSAFDISDFETYEDCIKVIYTSSSCPGAVLTICYTITGNSVQTEDGPYSVSKETALPKAFFSEGAVGETAVTLTVSTNVKAQGGKDIFSIEMK